MFEKEVKEGCKDIDLRRKQYSTPKVVEYGRVRELTTGGSTGGMEMMDKGMGMP